MTYACRLSLMSAMGGKRTFAKAALLYARQSAMEATKSPHPASLNHTVPTEMAAQRCVMLDVV